jgi:bifunctional UDP-N-acetylglucosamine pyrophosphorylase/glucosamine-1-phosphate N-acetyltransferase
MKKPLVALVLAAGEGSRFRSETNKVLHPLLGTSLLGLVLDAVLALKPDRTVVVTGRGREDVCRHAAPWGVDFAFQEERRGTGHAVLAAKSALPAAGDVLVVPGDLPLLRPAALKALVARHRRRGNSATVLSAVVGNPSGFGRIVRAADGRVRIVEDADANAVTRAITEVNTAVYVFDAAELRKALPKLTKSHVRGEYDLPDVIGILSAARKSVDVVPTDEPGDVRQVNTRYDLGPVVDALRDRKVRELSGKGVTVLNPASTWIDLGVDIGPESVIYPSVVIEGATTIGRGARIYPGAHLIGARLGDRVTVFSSTVIEGATIEDDVAVGPFARLRPRTILRAGARVGNFVEMKNTDFGRGAKAGHLSYLGDSEVQERVNIGAGTITCNYDGFRKNRTIIEAGAFIGSGTELVAPVRVGRGAYVAAGSVITKDVSPDALAVARGRQFEKPDWAKRRREQQTAEKRAKG